MASAISGCTWSWSCFSKSCLSTGGLRLGLESPCSGEYISVDKSQSSHKRKLIIKNGVSGDVLSSVATLALQSRLASYDLVETKVDCTLRGLLQGRVEGVRISGQLWRSPLELSCRSLEVSVSNVQLDIQSLIARQHICLQKPPTGTAIIIFNAKDFGHFLMHPLMLQASRTAVDNRAFDFRPSNGVEIVPFPIGSVSTAFFARFSGVFSGNGKTYVIHMSEIEGAKEIAVQLEGQDSLRAEEDPYLEKVRTGMTSFFNNLCLELDGTSMTFAGMSFVPFTDKSGVKEWTMRLVLDVVVDSFPPPNVSF